MGLMRAEMFIPVVAGVRRGLVAIPKGKYTLASDGAHHKSEYIMARMMALLLPHYYSYYLKKTKITL